MLLRRRREHKVVMKMLMYPPQCWGWGLWGSNFHKWTRPEREDGCFWLETKQTSPAPCTALLQLLLPKAGYLHGTSHGRVAEK